MVADIAVGALVGHIAGLALDDAAVVVNVAVAVVVGVVDRTKNLNFVVVYYHQLNICV